MVLMMICGCSVTKSRTEKVQDLEYSIVRLEEQPEEIQILVEENKDTRMKMSYIDQGQEYIIVGYGEQATSGYSIEVTEVYETENTVNIDTNLLGPASEEEIVEITTYPYVVICIKENEKPVLYD